MKERFDVVIVGAGLAGLGCAAQLVRRGYSVQVLERSSRLGGRAQSPRVGDLPMNLGAHALYLGGPGERWLTKLGVRWSGFQPTPSDTWLVDEDAIFESPTSLIGLLTARHFSLGERMGLLRFLGTLHRTAPETLTGLSAQAWIDRVAPGPRAQRLLETLVRLSTYSNAPHVLPARIALAQLQTTVGLHARGVAYVDGGWQTLLDGMAEAASGAQITTDAFVERVTEDGEVTLRGGGTILGRHVIVALPFGAARAICPALAPTSPRTPAHAACLDMVLDSPPSRRLTLGVDEPYYFSVHSPGTEAGPIRAHALRYLAPGESGAAWERPLDAWLARVVPDAKAKIVEARFLPEMEVTSALPSSSSDGPPPKAIGRVAFTGDWCSPNHLLFDAVAESAEAAVARVLAAEKAPAAA